MNKPNNSPEVTTQRATAGRQSPGTGGPKKTHSPLSGDGFAQELPRGAGDASLLRRLVEEAPAGPARSHETPVGLTRAESKQTQAALWLRPGDTGLRRSPWGCKGELHDTALVTLESTASAHVPGKSHAELYAPGALLSRGKSCGVTVTWNGMRPGNKDVRENPRCQYCCGIAVTACTCVCQRRMTHTQRPFPVTAWGGQGHQAWHSGLLSLSSSSMSRETLMKECFGNFFVLTAQLGPHSGDDSPSPVHLRSRTAPE